MKSPNNQKEKPNRAKSTPLFELLRAISNGCFHLLGWRTAGEMPDEPKFVAIGAPHTSNWDFLLMIAIILNWRVKLHWIGKHTIFKPPFGGLMRRLGGMPVNRNSSNGVVEQMVSLYNSREEIALAMSPEGTRAQVSHWKTGFYHIACQAKVPIVMCYVDYQSKTVGVGKTIHPTGDFESDMIIIREFYRDFKGRHDRTAH